MSKPASIPAPSCVLFDFDGTMYAFEDVYPHVWRELYDSHTEALSKFEFRDVYDRIGQIFDNLPQNLGADPEREYVFNEIKRIWPAVETPVEKLTAWYRESWVKHMRPREGLQQLLDQLVEHKIPWGIVSNSGSRNRRKYQVMGLGHEPHAFILSEEVDVWKPDPAIFDLAFQEISSKTGPVDRAASFMVGDTLDADIRGGNAAGMLTVLLTPERPAEETEADLVVTGFDELTGQLFDG